MIKNIVVCVKAVPDPKLADKVKIDPITKTLFRQEIPLVINPFDRHALELALSLKESNNAYVTVISMGSPEASTIVKECLAMGADQGILLSDPAFSGADAYATAFTLSAGIKKLGSPDLVLCGMASSDGSTEWVGPELSVFLEYPVVALVKEVVEQGDGHLIVKAEMEGGYRLLKAALPCVLTLTHDVNAPRKLSFSGIIKARKNEIVIWGMRDLQLDVEQVGLKGSPTMVTKMRTVERKRKVEYFEGTVEDQVERLLKVLSESGMYS